MVVDHNYSVLLGGPQLPNSALVAEKFPGYHKPKDMLGSSMLLIGTCERPIWPWAVVYNPWS